MKLFTDNYGKNAAQTLELANEKWKKTDPGLYYFNSVEVDPETTEVIIDISEDPAGLYGDEWISNDWLKVKYPKKELEKAVLEVAAEKGVKIDEELFSKNWTQSEKSEEF